MKHYETQEIPAKKKKVLVRTTCDICGADTETASSYEIDEVCIERRHGNVFPGDDNSLTESYDICGKCFETKLQPWLSSQGAEATERRSYEWEHLT